MDQTQRALLSTLYERWYGVLHRYAQWAVGDALLAEEIVQETFLAAVPKIEELAAGEHPERWLIQTAKYKALHVLRGEGIQCGLAKGRIGAGIVMGRQTAVGEVGLAAAADAQLAAGGGGTFQQGHVQAVGRGFAGAHKARRACPQDEDVRFPGSGV